MAVYIAQFIQREAKKWKQNRSKYRELGEKSVGLVRKTECVEFSRETNRKSKRFCWRVRENERNLKDWESEKRRRIWSEVWQKGEERSTIDALLIVFSEERERERNGRTRKTKLEGASQQVNCHNAMCIFKRFYFYFKNVCYLFYFPILNYDLIWYHWENIK